MNLLAAWWRWCLDWVRFDEEAAAPSAGEQALLDAIAATLVANPGLSLLELRGHAEPSERGAEALAWRRAVVVRDEMIRRGVAGERLAPSGEVRARGARDGKNAARYVELLNIRVGVARP